MSNYPLNSRRMAKAQKNPHRVSALRTWGRRRLRKAISPLLSPVQIARQTQLAAVATQPQSIVFLGDSISEGGLWSEWFPEFTVSNRGVSGENAAQVLERIDGALNNPKAVFLLIGTNDMASGWATSDIILGITKIVDAIEQRQPGTPVFVQSIMPRAVGFREEVIFLNSLLQELVDSRGPQVTYVDLWPVLATPEGALRTDYSEDKLHLNGAGYLAWTNLIRPLMEKL